MAANRDAAALSALKQLKGERPEFLRVFQDDNSVAQVATPNVKRWKPRTASILDSMPWRSFEPLDSKGNVIGPRQDNADTFEDDGGATDLEDLEQLSLPSHASIAALLALMLKAQDVALVRQKQAYDSVLENNQKLLTTITTRLQSMEQSAHDNFKMMSDLRHKLTSGGDDEGGDGQLMAEVLKLAQAQQAAK